MKIAMLGHKTFPSHEGGVEVVVEELAVRMAALGHDVTVYSRRKSDNGKDHQPLSEYKGVRIKTVRTIEAKGLAAASASFFAMRSAIQDRPDVIHVHAEGPCAVVGLAKQAGIRTVATIHGLDWQRAKWGKLASFYLKYGERQAVKHASDIVVLSQNVQQYFGKTYGRNTSYIPNGMSAKESKQAEIIATAYGLERDSYILFLARIVPEKGLHYLLDAFKKLDTDKRLVVAGGPSDSKEYYEAMKSRAESDPRVLFTGFVQGRELEELFSNAFLYVLPSNLEGMPISLLEAMAYGRCCLTSDIPECAEVLGNAGVTFAAGNSTDLGEKLNWLLVNKLEVEQLGYRAQERVSSGFNWDNVVKATLELYKDNGRDNSSNARKHH